MPRRRGGPSGPPPPTPPRSPRSWSPKARQKPTVRLDLPSDCGRAERVLLWTPRAGHCGPGLSRHLAHAPRDGRLRASRLDVRAAHSNTENGAREPEAAWAEPAGPPAARRESRVDITFGGLASRPRPYPPPGTPHRSRPENSASYDRSNAWTTAFAVEDCYIWGIDRPGAGMQIRCLGVSTRAWGRSAFAEPAGTDQAP